MVQTHRKSAQGKTSPSWPHALILQTIQASKSSSHKPLVVCASLMQSYGPKAACRFFHKMSNLASLPGLLERGDSGGAKNY